ncbi:MoxR family ATPase [Puia sp.]|jgi:MoxR-like ATPase|uniref:AAA family ATPase n=1 Tax=Puia sp. TaxID=2045100 RepID=UPI002F41AF82
MNKELVASQVDSLLGKLSQLKSEIGKVIVGQEDIVEELLVAMLAGGHCLLEGVPGLAKTLMVRTLAQALDLNFRRIQFTPDLMPTDILGTEVLEEDHSTGRRFFKFNKGPLFANIVLADEINRTPPKTQSALLEAMQEFEITYGGVTYPLDRPFFILATQNPIEQSGTYPLPEAQLDRFLLYIRIGYPSAEEETMILSQTTGTRKPVVNAVLGGSEIRQLQELVREVSISDDLVQYVATLIRATRPGDSTDEYVREWVRWGAGPRAGQALILTAKARALFHQRYAVVAEDIHAMALPVLRHRVLVNFKAEAENIHSDDVARHLMKTIGRPGGLLK